MSTPTMTPRPLVAIFVIGAIVSASFASAHAQESAPGRPPAPEVAAPAPAQSPPPGYPQYPAGAPPYQQVPGQEPQPIYAPQGPVAWPPYIKTWEEGQPVPYGYHPETRARKGLVITGAVLFGVLYLLSTLIASANDSSYDGNRYTALWIPVAGPFIQAGASNNASGDREIFVLDGVAQAAGVTMLVLGLAFPRHILVRNDLLSVSFLPAPMKVGHDGGGLGLVGRF
jgi:hypothetical protein